MAEGDDLRVSTVGSEDFYPFSCTPCSRQRRDTGAEVYCEQCAEYLCGTCLLSHNSFAKMAAHRLQDRTQMEAKGPQKVQPRLTVRCDKHIDQTYTLYCSKHDKICCPVCSQTDHKLCDVVYILDVTQKMAVGSELIEVTRVAKQLQTNLEGLKKLKQKDIQRLTADKNRELNNIQNTILKMIKQLKALENSAIADVTEKYSEYMISIEDDLNKLDVVLETLDGKLDKLETVNDEAEQFVYLNSVKDMKSNIEALVEELKANVGNLNIDYLIDRKVEESMKTLHSLGNLVFDYRYSVTADGKHSVDTKKNGKSCSIEGICLAADDTILATDIRNKCLKRFDSSFKLIARLKLHSEPMGVCTISPGQAAVTLPEPKTVQVVTFGKTMEVGKSFITTDNCHDIAFHEKHLFITCGGWIEKGEGQGHIAVYSIAGTLVRKIETDRKGRLFSSVPLGIAVRSMYDDVILVCDVHNGLVAIGENGEMKWSVTCEELEVDNVTRVSVDSHGQMLVSSCSSNKVVLVSRNGRKLGELLTASDGIKKPVGLCFDIQWARLMVGMDDNNQISVYRLN